jgi:hypothetical protein
MNVEIYSKVKMHTAIEQNILPANLAIISFYNEPVTTFSKPIDYSGVVDRFIQINLPDIDEKGFEEYGYTESSYFEEADEVAEFIYKAYNDGFDFACQCQFGFSRSAACAAAILEHFEGRGKEVFLSENYLPNIIVYKKLLNSLKKQQAKRQRCT